MKTTKQHKLKSVLDQAETKRRQATAQAIKEGKLKASDTFMFSEEMVKSAKFEVENVKLKS